MDPLVFVALALLALVVVLTLTRFAGRFCYRIDRDAYRRAQQEWADYRRASTPERQ